MSKKSNSQGGEPAPDLSALDLGLGLGPAWARNEPKKPRSSREGGGNNRSQSSDKDSRKRPANRRDHKGGDHKRNDRPNRSDKPRRDFKREGRPERSRPAPIAPPEGITARIMPVEDGLDAMAKQISDTGRTHSVFELAWVVLGGPERFNLVFESEKGTLFRSKSDDSVWLTQEECLAHFWSAELWKSYYDEQTIEVEAPSGNFPSVARCGMSQKLIAPPNHHSYQQAITDLHKEKFSNMSLDQYKSKIIIENSEEVIAEWKESMTKSSQWTAQSKSQSDAELQETAESESTPALSNRRDVEQHFIANGFAEEFQNGKLVSAAGSIAAAKISPGLFSLLKSTVAEEKRYPGNLASILCKQMSGRHLAVYKWKKRLHCGPARPKLMPEGLVMADRPTVLFKWIAEHPSGNLDEMWKDCLPADVDEEAKKQWYHDLHWLINEGQVLLFSDGKLHPAKVKAPEVKAKKAAPKKVSAKKAEDKASASDLSKKEE